jgi:uncharacterized protein YjbI with pentapeptide repeats
MQPSSNSSGTFTYNSGNTSVGTISGNSIIIAGAGTSTITANQAASGNYSFGSTTTTLTVNPISPTFSWGNITKNFGDSPFTVSASSNSSGNITYNSINGNVSTISGNIVTIVGAGSSTITANQIATTNYTSLNGNITLTVNKISPTLSNFGNITKNFGDADFTLTAPTSNSLGEFSYINSNTNVVIFNVGVLFEINNPTYRETVNNFPLLGSMSYWEMSIRFITTGGTNSWRALIGDMYNPVNTGRGWGVWVSSSNGLHFSWQSQTWDASPIAVSLNTEYILKINRTPTSLTFLLTTVSTNATQTSTNTNISSYVMTTNGPVTIGGWINTTGELFPGTISYITVKDPQFQANTIITIVGAGSTTITANQASTTNYTSGTINAVLTVNPISPNINTISNITKTFGDIPFRVSTTSNNSLGTFTYISGNISVATISDTNLLTIVGGGTSTITANISATTNYTSAITSALLTVNKAETLFNTFSSIIKTYGDAAFRVAATSSNSSGAITYTSNNESVATISDANLVTLVGVGTSTITATIANTTNHLSASTSTTLTVNTNVPAIGPISTSELANKTFGNTSFTITQPTSNSLGVFTYTSSNTGVAVISNLRNALNFDGVNDYINLGIPEWSNETQFSQTMSVECWFKTNTASLQPLAFPSLVTRNYGGTVSNSSQFSLMMAGTFTPEDNGAVIFGVTSAASNIGLYINSSPLKYNDGNWHHVAATYSSSTGTASLYVDGLLVKEATNINIGLTSILHTPNIPIFIGSDAGQTIQSTNDRNFQGSIADVRIWNVVRTPTEIFNNYAMQLNGNETGLMFYNKLDQGTVGGNNSGITTTTNNMLSGGNSGTLINFALSGSISNWVSGPEPRITILGAGTTTITATQAASGNYITSFVTATLTVAKATPTFSIFSNIAKSYTDAAFRVTASTITNNSPGIFSYISGNTSIATISDTNLVSIASTGSTTITGRIAETSNYLTADTSANLIINPSNPTIGVLTLPSKIFGDAPFTITQPTTNSLGVFSYTSSNVSVATISNSVLFEISPSTIPVLSLPSFPSLVSVNPWTITINFKQTSGQGQYRILLGNYWNIPDSDKGTKGWGIWVSPQNTIRFYNKNIDNSLMAVQLNINYRLIVTYNGTTYNFTLNNLDSSTSNTNNITSSNSIDTINTSIGGWALGRSEETFIGTISYVSVSNSQLAGNQINIVGAGTSTITANIASTNNFNSGAVSNTLTVARATTSISSITLPIKKVGDSPFTFSASTSNNTEAAITYSSSNTSITTVSGNTITIVGGGLCTISASQLETSNYTSGSISTTFIVIGLDSEYPSVNLYGANLAYSNFFSANFTNANLATSNLYYANLFDCDMVNADLSATNLEGVTSGNIRGTPTLPASYSLINGYIIGPKVSLQNANLLSQSITNANLFMANLTNAQLINSNLTNTNLTLVNLTNANIYGTNLANTNISSTVLNGIISGQITGAPVLPINYLLINGFIIGENVNLIGGNLININYSTISSTISYNAFDDFISGPTAQSISNNWQYFEVNTDRSTATLLSYWKNDGNSVISTHGQWHNNRTSGMYPLVQKVPTIGLVIDNLGTSFTGPALIMHPDESSTYNVGMGFKNNTNSTITITVNIAVSLLYPASNSDGLTYFIQRGLLNDSRYVSYVNSSIPTKSTSTYNFNQSNIELQIGEIIYLIINRNSQYGYDHTRVVFNVSFNSFTSVNLYNVNFTNSNLSGSNFTNTNLTNATFSGANLTDVILANTNVTNTNFSNASLNRLISSNLIGTPSVLPTNYKLLLGTAVYGSNWTQLGSDIDGEAIGDKSGYSISVSADGTIVAIGARFNDGVNGVDSGHVRVYKYDATKTTAITDQTNPNFGPIGWTRLGGDIDGEAADDRSGTSVSLSANGTVLAISANANYGVNGINSGHVRVYNYNPTKTTANSVGPAGWDKLGGDIDGEAAGDQSGGNDWSQDGVKISADGTIVAITAVINAGNGADSGQVRVYKYNPSKTTAQTNQSLPGFGPIGWDRLGADIDGEAITDYSGYSVGLSADGTIVAIGAWANDGSGLNAGHARVYQYTPSKTVAVTNQSDASFGPIGWTRLGADIDGEAAGDRSGTGIALSGDGTTVAIGAHFNNSFTGHVRVYRYNANKTSSNGIGPAGWDLLGADIDGEAINDQAGETVAISADGNIVAIGATGNTGSGTNAGHVRVYRYTPSKLVAVTNQLDASFGPVGWTRMGIDFDAEAAGDLLTRVALSSDGTRLVIGAIGNDGNGTDSGQVRVYKIDAYYDNKIIGPYVNLTSANIINANLTNSNIFGATLANAVIIGGTLNGLISGNLIGVPISLPTNYNLISGYIIGPFVNLNNANLFTSNFTNANLLGANINNINLSNATLNGLISGQLSGSPFALPTNFTTISGYFIGPSVNLTNASLTGANLTNANVYGATITNGSMSGTNLSGLVSGALTGSPSALPSNYSTISGYIIGPKVNLTNANLITSNLTNSNIVGATITNANLLNSTLNGLISGNLSGVPSSLPTNYTPISGYIIGPYVNLTSAVLTTSNLTNSNIYGVNITNALMSNTILDGLISGQLIGSTLSLPTNYSVISGFILGPKVNLTSAILTNSNLINANIYGATITNANIKNTTLVGLISGDLIGATTLFPSNYNLITGYIIGPYVNLTNANLVNSNLVNQNIYGVNITGANLLNSNINGLSSGELIGSPLSLPNGYSTISGYIIGPYTNLSSALLTNANLTNSNIYGVSLQNAVLQNTDLTGVISGNISGIPNTLPTNYDILDGYLIGPMVNLTDANLVISNLTNSNIYGATITNANLLNANFTRLISGFINGTTNNLPLDYSIISGYIIGPKVDLTAALLTTANLTNSNILGAIITNSNLSSTILDNVISGELIGTTTSLPINYQIQLGYIIGPNVNLANAILNNANLTNANIFTANLTNVNLSSANLTNANITGSKISNINLSNTQLNNMSSGELIGETIYLPPYYEINTGYIIGPFVNLSSANLSNNNLTNSNIYGSNVTNLNLSNAVLNGIISGQIVYSEGISLPTNYKMISGYIVGPSVNLTSANLSNSDLTNANIFNANLTNINLSNSILKGLISGNISSNPSLLSTEYIVKLGYIVGPFVSLVSANLENADLTNANIYGINISNANFSNVIFNGVRSGNIIGTPQSITLNYDIINDYVIGPYVNLFNSNLYGANLSNVILTGANMRNSNLSNAILTNTDLQTADLFNIKTGEVIGTPFFPTSFAMVNGYIIGPNVNLYEANLVGANLTNTTLTNANMVSSDLSLAIIINAQLDGATLINANIVGANLYNTSFINSNLNGANLNGAVVINTNFTNTDISGADISNISFTNVQKLQQQKNINNRDIPDIQLTSVPSEDILSQLSLSNTEDLADLTNVAISVLLPSNSVVNISSFTGGAFYIPTSNNENIIINNRVFYSDGNIIRDAITNQIVTCLKINNKLYRLISGSLIGIEVPLDEMYQFNGIGLNTVLDANNNNSKWINNYGNIYTNYTNMGVGIINPSYKIHTSGAVGATGFITTSDMRLKSNIRDIDDHSALNIVRLLTPKTYDYIDKVNNKTDTVYGFIAQEVSQVLPYTVDTISNFIPNLYTNIIIGNNVVYCLDRDIEFIIKDPNIVVYLKIYKSNKEIICRLATIINKRTFTIIESLEDGHYLLYGQMVDDFKTLKKDAIFTVCVAAMQEFYIVQSNLVSELINSKQKNQDLRSRLTYLETVIGNLIID